MGDLNIDLLKENTVISDFSNILYSKHFIPLITKATRFSPIEGERPSCLDHIWINKFNFISSGILNIDIGDHLPTFVNLKVEDDIRPKKVKIQTRKISDSNKINFINMLDQTDWNAIRTLDPNLFAENFLSMINELYSSAFPIKTKYISGNHYNKPWINSYLRELIAAKADYFQLYRLSLVTTAENNRFRNKVNNIIRNHKVKFYADLLSKYRGDFKKKLGN